VYNRIQHHEHFAKYSSRVAAAAMQPATKAFGQSSTLVTVEWSITSAATWSTCDSRSQTNCTDTAHVPSKNAKVAAAVMYLLFVLLLQVVSNLACLGVHVGEPDKDSSSAKSSTFRYITLHDFNHILYCG
jgi:hypothetical protein